MEIIVISPHPDDCVLGCSGITALHAEKGDNVHVLILSNGEGGGNPKIRVKEAKESAKILKIKSIKFFGLPDGKISDDIDTISLIEKEIEKIKPQRVYSNSLHDRHQDHRNTSLASLSAARAVPEIFLYETPSTLFNFSPTIFIDISKSIDLKIQAIKAHKSQIKKAYTKPDAIRGLAQFRGHQSRLTFAEAFELGHIIVKEL
ncbi:MAG: PIG-L family deacetylase [Euryarchaeota archaeon]|nr:PIG-L family deacetylase [Euryarchaeota archaeon]